MAAISIDRVSPTWLAIADWAKQERQAALIKLAIKDTSEREADHLRGDIARLDALLKLAEPSPPPIKAGGDY